MKKTMLRISGLLAAAVLLTACTVTPASQNHSTYTHISPDKAAEMMQQDNGSVIVDVRTHEEFAEGHIPGAVCIPNETITDTMPEELPDKEQIILIYCRTGVRAKAAAERLAGLGYEHVYEFGGIVDWKGEIVKETVNNIPEECQLAFRINDQLLYAVFAENASAEALINKLTESSIEITMSDYGGFEKVGPLPWDLPRSDERITTVPGDVILYQGSQLSIYYGENTWNFTRIGRIIGVSPEELREILGDGDIIAEVMIEPLDY